jgi:hypothetical protein
VAAYEKNGWGMESGLGEEVGSGSEDDDERGRE